METDSARYCVRIFEYEQWEVVICVVDIVGMVEVYVWKVGKLSYYCTGDDKYV